MECPGKVVEFEGHGRVASWLREWTLSLVNCVDVGAVVHL